jgi:hypothetical protein
MKTITRLFKLTVLVSLFVLALAACAAGDNVPASGASGQGELLALPSRLTLVYREPGSNGEVLAVFTASRQPLKIVGRNESGDYLAIALDHGQGWVAAGELELTGNIDRLPVIPAQAQIDPAGSPVAVTAVLTKVYAGPGFSYEITDILMAQENLQVLGRSADSLWLAVHRQGSGGASTGWIPIGDARLSTPLASLPVIPA